MGDAGRQCEDTSRLVDSSTIRLELCLRPALEDERDFDGWQLALEGMQLPLRSERDSCGPVKVFGVRLRSFVPYLGLHPTLHAHGPLRLLLHHSDRREALAMTLLEWRPDNQAYPGLPHDLGDARERCLARSVAEPAPAPAAQELRTPPAHALTPYSLDLRWLPPAAVMLCHRNSGSIPMQPLGHSLVNRPLISQTLQTLD